MQKSDNPWNNTEQKTELRKHNGVKEKRDTYFG